MKLTPVLLASAFIFAVICVFLSIRSCNNQGHNEPLPPAEAIRITEHEADSIKSITESQYRDSLQAILNASNERYYKLLAKLPKSKDKATTSVKQYKNTPTLANCDSAIADLQYHVSELETGLSISDSVMKGQARVIGSFAGTVARKDSVFGAMNAGWQQANLDNAELTRKVKNRNKAIRIGAGVIALLIGLVAVK